ncbi:MAG: SAM-dependent methyltransferase [Erysipelotrichaceae bacterium]|nr:SAM-dependent methyltransferase [Erysipelotrichaceae bacterium]
MKLHSKRLTAISEAIKKHCTGRVLADIGTDHALLPCYLVDQGIIDLAYACDVAVGPLASSKETITSYHLEDQVIPLLGDGLAPIVDHPCDMIAICGMGGILMSKILDAHPEIQAQRYCLQANTAIDELRHYLMTHDYTIIDETMVKDGRHIYEIIIAKRGHQTLSEEDIIFGPVLRLEQSPLFKEKWHRELETQYRILETLQPDHEKYDKIVHYKQLIEQVLNVPD